MDMIIRRLWGEVSEGVGWGSLEAPVQCDATELRLIDGWMDSQQNPMKNGYGCRCNRPNVIPTEAPAS